MTKPEEAREQSTLDGASQDGLPILILVHSRPYRILEFFGIQCFTHPYLNKQTAKSAQLITQWTKNVHEIESSTEPTVITGL